MKAPLKVGVAGLGKMGALHLEKYLKLDGAEAIGFYDSNALKSRALGERYGVRAFESLTELIWEADALSIATPTVTHYEIARQALEAGVHVLLEKPMTVMEDEARALMCLASEQKVVLQVGFVERFRFLARMRQRNLSSIDAIESHRFCLSPGRELDIDVVSDLMVHDLDLILSVVGEEPSHISASGQKVTSSLTDIAKATLEFANGTVAKLNASRVATKPMRKLNLFSSKEHISIDFLRDDFDALSEQCASFIRCIREGCPPVVSAADGLRALKYSNLIRQTIEVADPPVRHKSANSGFLHVQS